MNRPSLSAQLLQWHIDKDTRSFRVFVVEPSKYQPDCHTAIFYGALDALLRPKVEAADRYREQSMVSVAEPFDLVTFPEAFLPAADLAHVLARLACNDRLGCVHVGLRSSETTDAHLIGVAEFNALLAGLETIPAIELADLTSIRAWLAAQRADGRFNVGCLFAVDAGGRLRVCLHPKMVRSKFEVGAVADDYMTEGTLLSLITLLPVSKQHLSVTLQPIICSDALQANTDIPGRIPLWCVNSDDANAFAGTPPDHIDVVSVAACTPQQVGTNDNGDSYRSWHEEFCATFQQAGKGGMWPRHVHATFVLANFLKVPADQGAPPSKSYGGLSGAFIPAAFPKGLKLPFFAQVMAYGKRTGAPRNDWSQPARELDANFSSLGYIAHLRPETDPPFTAKMLGFTVTAFPRDTSHWKEAAAFARFTSQTGRAEEAGGNVIFAEEARDV